MQLLLEVLGAPRERKAEHLAILTATAFLNHVVDGVGYLSLLWRGDMELDEDDTLDSIKDLYGLDFKPISTRAYQSHGI